MHGHGLDCFRRNPAVVSVIVVSKALLGKRNAPGESGPLSKCRSIQEITNSNDRNAEKCIGCVCVEIGKEGLPLGKKINHATQHAADGSTVRGQTPLPQLEEPQGMGGIVGRTLTKGIESSAQNHADQSEEGHIQGCFNGKALFLSSPGSQKNA